MSKKETMKALVEIVDGKMLAIASTGNKDRMDDVMDQEKWDLKSFKKNPILIAGHNYAPENVIGIAKKIKIEGNKLLFEPVFHEITQLAKDLGNMVKEGYLKAFSVGFIPNALMNPEDKSAKNELLEISLVSVPANAEALMIDAKSYNQVTIDKVNDWLSVEKNTEAIDEVIALKPFPNEHACRLKDPRKFDKFRRGKRKYNGKEYSVIFGIVGGKSEEQAYRYDKDVWSAEETRKHCKLHDGSFEQAQKDESEVASENKELKQEVSDLKIVITGLEKKLETPVKPKGVIKPKVDKIKTVPKQPVSEKEMVTRILKSIAGNASHALKELKKPNL